MISASKDAERQELEAAMRRFQASGGEVKEIPIIPHREDYLRPSMREFDQARANAVKAGKRDERASQPHYLPTVRAIKAKSPK